MQRHPQQHPALHRLAVEREAHPLIRVGSDLEPPLLCAGFKCLQHLLSIALEPLPGDLHPVLPRFEEGRQAGDERIDLLALPAGVCGGD